MVGMQGALGGLDRMTLRRALLAINLVVWLALIQLVQALGAA